MIVCVDVHYAEDRATAACVGFNDWKDGEAAFERVITEAGVAAYEPGAFYKRELPPILNLLKHVDIPLDVIVIDGYVWLGRNRAGLGARLQEVVGTPVIGVAKTAFEGASPLEVMRGGSAKPLYVTSVGIQSTTAAGCVARMHGTHRIPTLLKRVDQLCRQPA